MASTKTTVKIEVIEGADGPCVAINDTRVAGPKLRGEGTVMRSWTVDLEMVYGALADNKPLPVYAVTMGGSENLGDQMNVERCHTELDAWKFVVRNAGVAVLQVWLMTPGSEPKRIMP